MARRIETFAELLAPQRQEVFFAQSWEQEPLHLRRGDERFYEMLLTHPAIEAAIASGGLRFPAIQLARDGGFYPAEAFTRTIRSGGDIFTGIPDLDRVNAEYRSGATISLPGFHRACKPLATLAAAIEAEFNHPVHTNVYVTPGNASGFAPHYDTHEVFVLQIAGRKRWRIHAPPLPLPHRSQVFDPRGYTPSPPILEIELAAGDLLYLPRGFVHATATAENFSVHVTLGVTVFTWVDLLADWVQSSRNHPALRRALPPGFAGDDARRQFVKDQLPLIVAELQRVADFDPAVDDFARRVRAAGGGNGGEFRVDAAVGGVELSRPD
jgi:hypothetical protein